MINNGGKKIARIVGICVGICTILGSFGWLVAQGVEMRSATRGNRQKIVVLEKKVDYIYDQAVEDALRKRITDSLTNYKLMVKVDSLVKVNGDST